MNVDVFTRNLSEFWWILFCCILNSVQIRMTSVISPSIELSSYRDQHFKLEAHIGAIGSRKCVPYGVDNTRWYNNCVLFANPMTLPGRELFGTRGEQERLLRTSSTLYVGNLSFYTTEEQIYELFSKCGDVKRIIMGLDKYKKTPCGFCFVEYYVRPDAENCMRYINGTRLDDRIIRTDWDAGFVEGRQYGRGKTGGQVRDEYRTDYDGGRGGYGKILQQKVSTPIQDVSVFNRL